MPHLRSVGGPGVGEFEQSYAREMLERFDNELLEKTTDPDETDRGRRRGGGRTSWWYRMGLIAAILLAGVMVAVAVSTKPPATPGTSSLDLDVNHVSPLENGASHDPEQPDPAVTPASTPSPSPSEKRSSPGVAPPPDPDLDVDIDLPPIDDVDLIEAPEPDAQPSPPQQPKTVEASAPPPPVQPTPTAAPDPDPEPTAESDPRGGLIPELLCALLCPPS